MTNVFDALDRDWEAMRRAPTVAAPLSDVLAIAGVATLGELEGWVRTASPAAADKVLLALVTDAVAGSALAARVTLQLLQPGVRRMVGAGAGGGGAVDRDERAAAALAAVYARIVRYPVRRRPAKVAANILMDAAQDLARRNRHHDRTIDRDWQCVEDGALPAVLHRPGIGDEARHPTEQLWSVLADAVTAGALTIADAELIAVTRIGRRRLAAVAAERGASLRTLQWRRRRAETALAGTRMAA
jgi:hypothetical protein